MTDRYIKNVSLLAVTESGYGLAASFVATDGIALVELPNVTFEPIHHDRALHNRFFGASEHLPASEIFKIKFKTEFTASGVPGTPPPVGRLLRACGFLETITAGNRVVYTPVSEGIGSMAMRYGQSGVRHGVRGLRGKVALDFSVGKPPMAEWEFWGFGRVPVVENLPGLDLSAWLRPQVMESDNASKLTFGATINGTGALTGGVVTRMRSAKISIDNDLQHYMYSDGEQIGIADRQIAGSVELGLTAAEEVQLVTDVRAVTTTSLAITHGKGAGNQIQVFGAAVQRISPRTVDDRGNLLISADTRWLPTGGDNDIQILFR